MGIGRLLYNSDSELWAFILWKIDPALCEFTRCFPVRFCYGISRTLTNEATESLAASSVLYESCWLLAIQWFAGYLWPYNFWCTSQKPSLL